MNALARGVLAGLAIGFGVSFDITVLYNLGAEISPQDQRNILEALEKRHLRM